MIAAKLTIVAIVGIVQYKLLDDVKKAERDLLLQKISFNKFHKTKIDALGIGGISTLFGLLLLLL